MEVMETRWGKRIRIRSYSGPYSVRMWENKGQNNSKRRHFSRGGTF